MKNLTLYIDLAFCLIVLPVMVALWPVERWFHHFTVYMVMAGIWLYAAYFINRFIAIPLLFGGKGRKACGIAVVLISVTVTFQLARVELYNPKPSIHDAGIVRHLPKVEPYKQALWTLFTIVEIFSFAVGLLTQANRQRARRRQAESDRDKAEIALYKAEIALYKAQIKPHFMFNTLNSLYGLFLTGNPKALSSLEKYISMMRYIHISSSQDFVPVSEEAAYIREYAELQSLRLNDMTGFALDIDIRSDDFHIPPMLLVTFVENCFKHGVSPVEKSRIDIVLRVNDGILEFTTSNHVFHSRPDGAGMGIDNCRKRLELLYPDKYELLISNDGVTHRGSLRIDLTS
ncbi:MAG: histidine kinase [Muribaculaceae bacterium]|nr:histidine kinase [Muribaculaceae bacterium]